MLIICQFRLTFSIQLTVIKCHIQEKFAFTARIGLRINFELEISVTI